MLCVCSAILTRVIAAWAPSARGLVFFLAQTRQKPWNKGGFSLRQCPVITHSTSAASAARRAHFGSARAAPPPQRERVQWRASALHAKPTSREVRARSGTWEHGLAQQEGRHSAGASRSMLHGRALHKREAALHRCKAMLPCFSSGPNLVMLVARVAHLRATALALSGEEA